MMRLMKHLVGFSITPEQTLARARLLMERGRCSSLPVVLGSRIIGILTLRDLELFIQRKRQLMPESAGESCLVSHLMRSPVQMLPSSTPLGAALREMLTGGREGLGVLVGDECLGVLSRDNLLDSMTVLADRSDLSLGDVSQLARRLNTELR
jgi:CBS domain-containing protein